MRPISIQHDALKYSLDFIMGSEANVRLLRVLIHEVDSSLSATDAARLAGLTPAGARRALDRLLDSGLIERVGSGRAMQYRLRNQDPLLQPLAILFDKEGERYDSFLSSLRNALLNFTEVRTAWLNRDPMRSGAPIEMCVVADAKAIDWISEELRARLKKIEQEYDLIIEVNIFTRADSPTPGSNAEFIVSMEANRDIEAGQPPSHALKDQRSLLMAQEITKMLKSDPSLITRAKHHLTRLLQDKQGAATHAISEWRQLLETYSPRQISQLLVSTSPSLPVRG